MSRYRLTCCIRFSTRLFFGDLNFAKSQTRLMHSLATSDLICERERKEIIIIYVVRV